MRIERRPAPYREPSYEDLRALSYAQLLSSYTAVVAELEAETAAYRASQPAYARLQHTFKTISVPLLKRAWLAQQRGRIADKSSSEEEMRARLEIAEKGGHVGPIISLILGIHKDDITDAQKAVPTDSKEKRKLSFWGIDLDSLPPDNWDNRLGKITTVGNPLEFTPFDKDSLEYYCFSTYLVEAYPEALDDIWNALASGLPEATREKEQLALRMFELLKNKAGPDQRKTLPREYENALRLGWRKELLQGVDDFTAMSNTYSEASKRGEKVALETLDELSKTVEAEIQLLIDRAKTEGSAPPK